MNAPWESEKRYWIGVYNIQLPVFFAMSDSWLLYAAERGFGSRNHGLDALVNSQSHIALRAQELVDRKIFTTHRTMERRKCRRQA